jgi:hypothetical protein
MVSDRLTDINNGLPADTQALFLIVFPPAVFGLQSALERSSIFDLVISRAKHSCSAIEISPQSARQIEFPALTHLACPFPAPGSRFGVMVLASAPDSAPKSYRSS